MNLPSLGTSSAVRCWRGRRRRRRAPPRPAQSRFLIARRGGESPARLSRGARENPGARRPAPAGRRLLRARRFRPALRVRRGPDLGRERGAGPARRGAAP
jgi:hypothetical protein